MHWLAIFNFMLRIRGFKLLMYDSSPLITLQRAYFLVVIFVTILELFLDGC